MSYSSSYSSLFNSADPSFDALDALDAFAGASGDSGIRGSDTHSDAYDVRDVRLTSPFPGLTAQSAMAQAEVYHVDAGPQEPRIEYYRWPARTPAFPWTVFLVPGAGHQVASYARLPVLLAACGITTVGLNLRGHGQSTLPTGQSLRTVRLRDAVADVRAVRDDARRRWGLADEHIVLLGHSLGTFVAFGYAEQYEVGGLVALGGPAPHCWLSTYGSAFWWMLRKHLRLIPAMMLWNPGVMFATPELRATLLLSADTHPEYVSPEVTDEITQLVMGRETAAISRDLIAHALRGYRPVKTDQVLFVCGTHDWFFSEACIRQSAADYPHSQAIFVEGPHNIMQAGDWRGAGAAIAAFVRRTSAQETFTASAPHLPPAWTPALTAEATGER